MSNLLAPATTVGQLLDTLSGMKAQEIRAVNVVLRCLVCPSFDGCETAAQLVKEPLLLLEYEQESRR